MKNKFLLNFFLLLALLLASCTPVPAKQATEAPASPTTAPGTQPPSTPTEVPTTAVPPTATTERTEVPTATSEPVTLNVFAAASLTKAFTEIGAQFQAMHPNVIVVFNFAGSTQLAQQINEGAPVDVFASANKKQMDVAVEGGRIMADTSQVFVNNRLVVIYPTDNPGGVSTLQDLAKPGLRIVLAAAEVPVGQYSLDFMDKAILDPTFSATFKDDVLANVVSYEDNVKAVLAKVALGEADAGIVYTSDISGENASNVATIEIPDELNVIATYPIAPVSDGMYLDLASEFIAYVLSSDGQVILTEYGFIPVSK